MAASKQLANRRLAMVPADSVFTEVQGRGAVGTGSMSAADLVDLISSIGAVGVLEPILLEEMPDGGYRLVAGERRLRAVRWGRTHDPDNPHFAAIPAVISPGPLLEAERRCWQLVENLAREGLRPGELGAGLLLERCALLAARLRGGGVEIPADVEVDDDPVRRYHALERLRGTRKDLAAPWEEVITRLGLRVSARKARAIIAAFAALPPELSADMDALGVSLTARLTYAQLDAGREAAAADLWAAVKERGRPELLGAAAAALAQHDVSASTALLYAENLQEAANESRGARLRRQEPGDMAETAETREAPADLVTVAIAGLRALLDELRGGGRVARLSAGSLRLYAAELLALMP